MPFLTSRQRLGQVSLTASSSLPDEKAFRLSLVISVLMHLVGLASLFYANMDYTRRNEKIVEIVYQIQARKTKPVKPFTGRGVRSLQPKAGPLAPKILSKRETLATPFVKTAQKQPVSLDSDRKEWRRSPLHEGKRFVSVPLLDSGKISNPKYLNYHEHIRNRIRSRAYLYVDNPQFDVGEVYLTFVLLADGALKQIKIIDQKTAANDYLRMVGLRSVKESSPFPPFPEDLEYPELSFNVIISFKVSE